jgi:glycosyltransferase involved in cell wall biosynthesis
MLRERAPKVKLVILGRGALDLGSASPARDLGVGDLAFFLGFQDEAPRVFASLDGFVLSSEQEGPRASIMDAMAAGLPVVATQVGGVPEIVLHGETGYLVSPRSPRALAEAVFAVYKDPDLARRFGERGHQVVHERFSSLAMARRAIALFKRIAYRKMVKLGA